MPSILARLSCLLHIGLKLRPAKYAYDSHVNTELASGSGLCNHCDAKQTHLKPVAVQHPVQAFIAQVGSDPNKVQVNKCHLQRWESAVPG